MSRIGKLVRRAVEAVPRAISVVRDGVNRAVGEVRSVVSNAIDRAVGAMGSVIDSKLLKKAKSLKEKYKEEGKQGVIRGITSSGATKLPLMPIRISVNLIEDMSRAARENRESSPSSMLGGSNGMMFSVDDFMGGNNRMPNNTNNRGGSSGSSPPMPAQSNSGSGGGGVSTSGSVDVEDVRRAPSPEVEVPSDRLSLPQGVSLENYTRASELIKERVAHISDDIVVQGSRAGGTATSMSDIDFAIRVSPDVFEELIIQRFGTPNAGSAKERTMLHSIDAGKIQAGEAGLRVLRKELQSILGLEVDISVIKIGGQFDNPPRINLP